MPSFGTPINGAAAFNPAGWVAPGDSAGEDPIALHFWPTIGASLQTSQTSETSETSQTSQTPPSPRPEPPRLRSG